MYKAKEKRLNPKPYNLVEQISKIIIQRIEGITVNDEGIHELLNEVDVSYNGRVELWDYFQVKKSL